MDTYCYVFGNNNTTTGAVLRCTSGINQCYHPTSVCSFVGGEPHELTPGYVRNAPADRLVAVDLHILDVEFFKSDELVFIYQFARFLVSEIVAPIGRTFVGMAKGVNHLAPFGATLSKAFFLSLQSGDVCGILLHPSLALNLVPVAEIGKGHQAKVNPDNVGRRLQWLGFTFAGEASVEVSDCIALDGQGFDVGADGAMQLYRNVANLGNGQLITNKFETGLLEGERVIQPLALKAGVSWFFTSLDATKERLKRQVNPFLHILQYLGMNRFQGWLIGFPLRQQFVGIIQA